MGIKADKAKALSIEGYNCAQSVYCAFCEDYGMSFEQGVKIASSFGGGMGKLGEVCGALTGAFMVLGSKYGYTAPGQTVEKPEHYNLIRTFGEAFRKETGSLLCRELQNPETPCIEYVNTAACLLEEFIERLDKNK